MEAGRESPPIDAAFLRRWACERWLTYRDTRNETAHDYGEILAESTLELLPGFIADARALADIIEGSTGD